jgi:hypothetical protein
MNIVHELKLTQPYFEHVWQRKKLFEIRLNDRDFKVGDQILLREYDPKDNTYTSMCVFCTIGYILSDYPEALKPGFVVLGLTDLQNKFMKPKKR